MTRAQQGAMRVALRALRLTCAAVFTFVVSVRGGAQDSRQIRRTPESFDFAGAQVAGAGTSGLAGIRTIVLKGDPTKPGLYTILLRVPAHTKIAAHRHPDDRIATVVSGTWYFGYGRTFASESLRALPVGSFYTEPPGDDHFAETRESAVMVQITGVGPTGTTYVGSGSSPPR